MSLTCSPNIASVSLINDASIVFSFISVQEDHPQTRYHVPVPIMSTVYHFIFP